MSHNKQQVGDERIEDGGSPLWVSHGFVHLVYNVHAFGDKMHAILSPFLDIFVLGSYTGTEAFLV